jgi:electron transfer flavoprotein alpha subunit
LTSLVVAEHNNEMLRPATLHAVTAAAKIGSEITVLVAGSNCIGVAKAAARISDVSKVLHADSPAFAEQLAETLAVQVVALADGFSHILVPATVAGKSLAPRVAALLDVAQVSEILTVESPDTFTRPIYAGSSIATVQSSDPVKVLTVRMTAFAQAGFDGSAPIQTVTTVADMAVTRFLGRRLSKQERPELGAARVVVSGGRGMRSVDEFRLLEPLADKLNAAIGASRGAVDAGYAPNDWQVGQTGKVVAPRLYVAIGISGAIQHLAGMKDSEVIVAINIDPDAPIFQVADFGLVADLFTAVPALTDAL